MADDSAQIVNAAINSFIDNYLLPLNALNVHIATGADILPDNGSNQGVITFSGAVTQSLPSDVSPPVDREKFLYWVNGLNIEHTAVVSANQVGNDFIVTVDNDELGFKLNPSDEIFVWGMFS